MNCWQQFALMEILKRIRQEDPELWARIVAYGLKPEGRPDVVRSNSREETTA
jgi:hypothetical protein